MNGYYERKTCRLCDSADLTRALDLGETPLANALDSVEVYPLAVNRCGSCGHHQLTIVVDADKLWGPGYVYQSGTSPVFRKHLEALADEVAALKPGGRVLEIASNDGTLLRLLAERKCDVLGVDPSATDETFMTIPRAWPLQFGAGMFENEGKPDVIIALNVFAHVDDLHSFTAAVKEALAPDGVFIVEVGWAASVSRKGHFDTVYHEHLSYHTLDPLLGFFRRHGLVVTDVHVITSQGGSLRLYVKHEGVEEPGFDDEGIDMGHMRKRIHDRAAALRTALNNLFHRGEMVCIYGAPAKLTTLLYATGLERMPFNCVGDDNPRKVGRTTPGNHIPIVSVEDMLARKPDAIVVAAWNFFDDIRDKLRRLGYAGDTIYPMRGS